MSPPSPPLTAKYISVRISAIARQQRNLQPPPDSIAAESCVYPRGRMAVLSEPSLRSCTRTGREPRNARLPYTVPVRETNPPLENLADEPSLELYRRPHPHAKGMARSESRLGGMVNSTALASVQEDPVADVLPEHDLLAATSQDASRPQPGNIPAGHPLRTDDQMVLGESGLRELHRQPKPPGN